MRLYLTVLRQLSQPCVASEQGPLARFRNRKCKRVWSRKGPIAASNFDRPSNLDGCERLDAKTKLRKLIAQFSLEFAFKEEIRNGELHRKPEDHFEKAASLQVDQDRGVGDEDTHVSRRHLIQPGIQFTNR